MKFNYYFVIKPISMVSLKRLNKFEERFFYHSDYKIRASGGFMKVNRRIICLYLTGIIVIFSCKNSDNKKDRILSSNLYSVKFEYYSNGNIKEISHYYEGGLNGHYKLYNETGSIIHSGFYKNNKIYGLYYIYHYIENDTIVYINQLKNGKFNGKFKVIFNKKTLCEGKYVDGKKNGEYKIYYLNGQIMYYGEFFNDGLCYLNKIDLNGNVIETLSYHEVFAQEEADNIYIYGDFCIRNKEFDSIDYAYSFYKISSNFDTINMNNELFEQVYLKSEYIKIPFRFERKGKYLYRPSWVQIENGNKVISTIGDLSIEFDKSGKLIYSAICPEISINVKYPYQAITQLTDSQLISIKNRSNTTIVFQLPKSKYNQLRNNN